MSDITWLSQQHVAILGFGVNNRELTGYLLRNGVKVTIRDSKQELQDTFEPQFAEFGEKVAWEIMPNIFENLDDFTVLFRSPVIPVHHPALQKALKRGAVITSQTQLFLDLCPALTIGVTGTKGKGTTSSLIFRMLSKGYTQGKVFLAGNIGTDPFSYLDQLSEDDIIILELSSFQLEDLHSSPNIAVLLSVAEDHLDHHRSLDEYRAAKANILAHQHPNDIAIINDEHASMHDYRQFVRGKLFHYTRHLPRQQSAWAERLEDREVVFVQTGQGIESFDITDRLLLGEHNLENILPATIVGAHFHISPVIMQQAVVSFRGLEHRLSLVGEYNGVRFYDDSIATTPESCVVAVEAFAGHRIHVIVGGKDKGQKHEMVSQMLVEKCTSISFMPGAVTAALRKNCQREVKRQHSECMLFGIGENPVMETILSGIHPHLQAGDIVLLAPSAASDTPFDNYKQRGEAFVAAVKKRYQPGYGS